uniref:Nuclear pore complex protein Nup85 n=1 Tax=Anthurium amnicola TaxID=1678845 RepID=A0A1D1YN61_9ARAE
MPGHPSDPGQSLVPFSSDVRDPVVYRLRHGVKPPIFRVYVSWTQGNLLHVACLRQQAPPDAGEGDDPGGPDGEVSGKVVEVKLGGAGDGEIGEAQWRRIAYGSVPAFALLQSRRNSLAAISRMHYSSLRAEWWQHILEYSNHIADLLGTQKLLPESIIDDPKMVVEPLEGATNLKAAWRLVEFFYADNESKAWLPEFLVDWLADYDGLLSTIEPTGHSKLVALQKKLVDLQVIEDDPDYWEGLAVALSVGWLDIVVKLLRLHGSYQPDQLDDRETENGLVEAVAVLVSTMPRLRPDLPTGKLGQCYKMKPDFIKAREKWQSHISKLDCSAFWVQCGHHQTREGLRNLLRIMLGQFDSLDASTCHWMELYISHFLYVQPFTVGLERMYSLATKCMQLKPASSYDGLSRILIGILGENTEVVLAECSRMFGPWMVVHAIELLATDNKQAEALLHEERYNLGGISIEELHRLVYAQVLSSHSLTWQIAPTYLASCPKQGLGLLEILLYKQPIQHYALLLKDLEICRLYELENISSSVMKIAGMYHWKHGRKGFGLYCLQQARDEVRLNRIAQQLFDCIGKSISDDSFKQWEGLIELLGSEAGSAGGLEFLHKYRDFKRSLHNAREGRTVDAARQSMESLIQLMKNASTPQRFWLPLLHDSVRLLNWWDRPLLTVSETNLLLNKLQELSLARLHPDFVDADLPPEATSAVRLALATNLGRAILEEC